MTITDEKKHLLADVALFAPLTQMLTYAVPDEMAGLLTCGMRVIVPLQGRRSVVGIACAIRLATIDEQQIGLQKWKEISEVLDSQPTFSQSLLDFLLWSAQYYFSPPGEMLRAALPALRQAKQQQTVALTVEGQNVLLAQQAILKRSDEMLRERELELLKLVSERGSRRLTWSQIQKNKNWCAAFCQLQKRGLLSLVLQRGKESKPLTDWRLTLEAKGRQPSILNPRARGQIQLWQLLEQAGGTSTLQELKTKLPQARKHAVSLHEQGLLQVEEITLFRDPFGEMEISANEPPRLTAEQNQVFRQLSQALIQETYQGFLLHGVTGSGKTEVYLQIIAQALKLNKQALVLVPEIALTPQLAGHFRVRFGQQVAVLHSGLSDIQRDEQWQLIKQGQRPIVVGARSAIFAPLTKLGVIIVDEEHDSSFKQEEGVRYHARDLALVRAKRDRAIAVLGSATPSLESFYGSEQGRLTRLVMSKRVTERSLPAVEIIDLRKYMLDEEGVFSAPLRDALKQTLAKGEQTILFLNRRGFSTFILCRSCGYVWRCPQCSVSLTYHQEKSQIICHYCGHVELLPSRCTSCKSERIGLLGLGTEKVEAAVRQLFPSARVARLDRDTATVRGTRSIVRQFGKQEIDILVGTQMVTKGHDFPGVTLVGVVCADLGLNFPDFRASERTFQLLTQVAGRAGRGERPGRVIIQTYQPEHASLECAKHHDYQAFYEQELPIRIDARYPPDGYLALLRFSGKEEGAVRQAALAMAQHAKCHLTKFSLAGASILGPSPAPLAKIKGQARWLLLLKAQQRTTIRSLVDKLLRQYQEIPSGIRMIVDIDPLTML